MRRRAARRPGAERGFTFIGLMFLVMILALTATAASTAWSFASRRDKELQLLYAGREYRVAIQRYRQAHAMQQQPYPTSLDQLLGDGDKQAPRRYLRRLFFDPITGSDAWGQVRNAQGGITGVFTLSTAHPVRSVSAYADEGIDFGTARSYRDWVFSALDRAAEAPAGGTAPDDDSRPLTPGKIPGWNYDRDGEPPARWSPAHPAPTPGANGG